MQKTALNNTKYLRNDTILKIGKAERNVSYEVRCLKSDKDMILTLAGQFKQVHETIA